MPTMDDYLTLDNGRMTVLLDTGRGADILSVMPRARHQTVQTSMTFSINEIRASNER